MPSRLSPPSVKRKEAKLSQREEKHQKMETNDNCTVHVTGLPAFNISAFQSGQHVDQEKNGFEAVTPANCFNEVVASHSQDGSLSRYV